MKINCGPTWQEKKARFEDWHDRFAWLPVRIGSDDCRWLETIERRGKFFANYAGAWWEWEHRAK